MKEKRPLSRRRRQSAKGIRSHEEGASHDASLEGSAEKGRKRSAVFVTASATKRARRGGEEETEFTGACLVCKEPPDTSGIIGFLDQLATIFQNGKDACTPSNVVRVHGLPLQTTPEHVIAFFRGLMVERVIVLPTMPHYIPSFDCLPHDANCAAPGDVLQRHANTFRLLVQFPSSSVANLAVERSGETLRITNPIGNADQDRGTIPDSRATSLAAAIAVTPIPKLFARFLLKNMAVDVAKMVPLRQTLSAVDAKLPPFCKYTLWRRMAAPTFPSWFAGVNLSNADVECLDENEQDVNLGVRDANLQEMQRLTQRFRTLSEDYARLEFETTQFSLQVPEAYRSFSADDRKTDVALQDVTNAVSDWFEDELDRLHNLLCQYRIASSTGQFF